MQRKIKGQIAHILPKAWTILGIALLYAVVLEGTARTGYAIHDNAVHNQQIGWLLDTDIYRNQDWAADYLREQDHVGGATAYEWHSYTYWRHNPHRGKYINIDGNGIRKTWNPNGLPTSDQIKIFMFGGSALWGIGARDEFTIPSFLSKKLNAASRAAWVTNFGEDGYVSTQELIALMVELQKGNVPDLVVFYDGANDVFSAFQQGAAGIPENEFNRTAEFDLWNWRKNIVEKLGLYRLSQTVASHSSVAARTEQENATLARAVLDAYRANMQIVESLAQAYGFETAFFWQPVIYNKKNLSDWEKIQLDTYGEARFFERADQALKASEISKTHPSFHDLSDAFGDQSDTVFMDLFHISEAGNEQIANLILQMLPLQ